NAALIALLEGLKPGSTFWVVGDQSVLSQMPMNIPGPGGQGAVSLPPVKTVVVTGELDPVVAVEGTGEAADPKAAQSLGHLGRGPGELGARLGGPAQPPAGPAAGAEGPGLGGERHHGGEPRPRQPARALRAARRAPAQAPAGQRRRSSYRSIAFQRGGRGEDL